MLTRLLLGTLALVAFVLPASAQQAAPPTVYTFVAEWEIPRAQWPSFSSDFEKVIQPALEKLAAGGTLVGWGGYENVVHTPNGYTHGTWWQATSYANLEKARLELLKASAGMQAMAAATGHRDFLLRTIGANAKPGSGTGYLTVSSFVLKPGKGREWKELWDKYNKPISDELVAKGALAGVSVHVQDVHTDSQLLRYTVTLAPSAEADDQVNAAFDAANAKLTQQERTQRQVMFDGVLEPGAHRDQYARVIRYWSK